MENADPAPVEAGVAPPAQDVARPEEAAETPAATTVVVACAAQPAGAAVARGIATAAALPGPSTGWLRDPGSADDLMYSVLHPASRSAGAGEDGANEMAEARCMYRQRRFAEMGRLLGLAAARGHFEASLRLAEYGSSDAARGLRGAASKLRGQPSAGADDQLGSAQAGDALVSAMQSTRTLGVLARRRVYPPDACRLAAWDAE